jgi:3-hydroxyacyl-CoA dehydrogenase
MFVAHGLVSEAQRATAFSRVTTTTRLEGTVGADLVIEALPEDMALKLKLRREELIRWLKADRASRGTPGRS